MHEFKNRDKKTGRETWKTTVHGVCPDCRAELIAHTEWVATAENIGCLHEIKRQAEEHCFHKIFMHCERAEQRDLHEDQHAREQRRAYDDAHNRLLEQVFSTARPEVNRKIEEQKRTEKRLLDSMITLGRKILGKD